jgi:hypothetical protein
MGSSDKILESTIPTANKKNIFSWLALKFEAQASGTTGGRSTK